LKRADNIVGIGGMACGPKAAARARRCDPEARITIVEEGGNVSEATCGLPYHISGVIDRQSELVRRKPDFFKDVLDGAGFEDAKFLDGSISAWPYDLPRKGEGPGQ